MWHGSLVDFYFIIILRFICCCQCNKSFGHERSNGEIHTDNNSDNSDLYIEKRQLDFDEFSTTDVLLDNITDSWGPELTTAEPYTGKYEDDPTPDYNDKTMFDSTDLAVELNDYTTPIPKKVISEIFNNRQSKRMKQSDLHLTKKCKYYKKGASFDLKKMADVWQIAYYRLPNKLNCFKIYIKFVNRKEQEHYARLYGNFNGSVHWHKCNLEIKAHGSDFPSTRRHFLQGTERDKGVMDNIVIDEEHFQNMSYMTLRRESGDQWLVIKNLLVMRDCDTSDVVVFSRVPLKPRQHDIMEALMVFGEKQPKGVFACEEKKTKAWLQYE